MPIIFYYLHKGRQRDFQESTKNVKTLIPEQEKMVQAESKSMAAYQKRVQRLSTPLSPGIDPEDSVWWCLQPSALAIQEDTIPPHPGAQLWPWDSWEGTRVVFPSQLACPHILQLVCLEMGQKKKGRHGLESKSLFNSLLHGLGGFCSFWKPGRRELGVVGDNHCYWIWLNRSIKLFQVIRTNIN